MQELIVGVDVAMHSLMVCEPTDEPKKPSYIPLSYKTKEDIALFIQRYEGKSVHFILEFTGCYHKRLVFALCKNGFKVSLVPSKKSYHYSQVQNIGTKTDKSDARNLQKMGVNEELAVYTAPNEKQDQIKQKRSYLQKLYKRLQAVTNRLHAWDYEPYGDPLIKQMEEDQKESLKKNIAVLEKALDMLIEEEDKKDIQNLQSIAGVGIKTATAVVACVKSMPDFEQHTNSKKLVKFVGLSPQVSQSGTQDKSKSRTRAGQNQLRACLYQGAKSTIHVCKKETPFKLFFEKLRAKGKSYKKALAATMHKMLRVCFAILKTGKTYDPEYTCAN